MAVLGCCSSPLVSSCKADSDDRLASSMDESSLIRFRVAAAMFVNNTQEAICGKDRELEVSGYRG